MTEEKHTHTYIIKVSSASGFVLTSSGRTLSASSAAGVRVLFFLDFSHIIQVTTAKQTYCVSVRL